MPRQTLGRDVRDDGGWIDTGASNLEVFTASGVVPSGVLGNLQLRSFDRDAAAFRSVVLPHILAKRAEPIAVDLTLDEFTLSGPIESIYGTNIVHYRSATLKVRDRLRAWVDHLARSATDPAPATANSPSPRT